MDYSESIPQPSSYAEAEKKLEGYNPFIDIPLRVCTIRDIHNGEQKWVKNCQSNHVVVIRNCTNTEFIVQSNQRLNILMMVGCTGCTLTVLDSVVVATRATRCIDCDGCKFVFEDVDIRKVECYRVKNSQAVFMHSPPVVENSKVYWRSGCSNNEVQLGVLAPADGPHTIKYDVIRRLGVPDIPDNSNSQCVSWFDELEYPHNTLQSSAEYSSADEILKNLGDLEAIPFALTKEQLDVAYDEERKEYEEPIETVREKAKQVANILREAKHPVCYTGAGVSTSANIPDFRGPQGVWTLKAKGKTSSKVFDEDSIVPTFTHYAITELARKQLLRFVMSTNMDSLHLRSGLPLHLISEQHGNGHKERCTSCRGSYYRQFRTTYSTDFWTHHTGRMCKWCGGPLRDTIVNFSENLQEEDMLISCFHARKSDAALVLGTSMNVQPAASFPDKCLKNDGKLVIVNLQKTPYDNVASVRIFAKTDVFMQCLMEELGLTDFDMTYDCISEWDPPTDDTVLPPSTRKRMENEKKMKTARKFVLAGLLVAAAAVVVAKVVKF